MALSNIFREPRREITESVVGLTIAGGLLWADCRFARWLQNVWPYTTPDAPPLIVGMIFGLVGVMVAMMFFALTHALGDGICNVLQTRGIHLRPRQRR